MLALIALERVMGMYVVMVGWVLVAGGDSLSLCQCVFVPVFKKRTRVSEVLCIDAYFEFAQTIQTHL